MGQRPTRKLSADLLDARQTLEPFLSEHPESSVIDITREGEVRRFVRSPWNDPSVGFQVPNDPDAFYRILNSLILPSKFSAIYHKLTNRLEVIWTAYRMLDSQKEIIGRAFKFSYAGTTHKCSFGQSSDELLQLGDAFVATGVSITGFRNLYSFSNYMKLKTANESHESIDQPISFWIDNLVWDQDAVLELVSNLNFYLSYYDAESPTINIWQDEDTAKPHPRSRYVSGKFPSNISGKRLDNNLISFWNASSSGDAARRFQYYYRIIEYASFFYLESSARIAVKRILAAPDAIDDIASATDKLMSAFQMSKLDDHAKFAQLLQDTVDPKLLWCEIKGNIAAFSKDIKFDGGYVLKAIISPTAKESTFIPKGVDTFAGAIRNIRNALSHGRDFKSSMVIIPSSKNLKALQPWVHLIAIAAGQVVLFKDVP